MFSSDGTLISTSAAPHCGGGGEDRIKRREEGEREERKEEGEKEKKGKRMRRKWEGGEEG